jgi:hypothetical protein
VRCQTIKIDFVPRCTAPGQQRPTASPLWRDQGKRVEARDLLAPICNWFTEGFDTPVLKEAKATLLDELQ